MKNASEPKTDKAKKTDWIAVLGLLVITIVFFGRAASGRWVFFHEDLHYLFYPMKVFYVESLQAGRLPLWNPYIGAGYPQFAEGQIAAFYPLNYLLFAFLPLTLAFNWNIILHFALAGSFFFAFLRRRGLGVWAAFIGASIFEWSGFMVGHLQHPSIFCSVAWLPLLLYFLEAGLQRARAQKENVSRTLAAGLVIALQLLVGYPPMVFYSVLIALLYVLLNWAGIRKEVQFRRVAGLFLGSLLVGFSLSAVQWMSTVELATHSDRAALTRVIYMTFFSLSPKHLLTFIFPHFLGSTAFGTYVGEKFFWEVCGYLGLISLFLAGTGAVKRWSRTWPFVVIGAIGLLLAVGRLTSGPILSTPVNPIYYLLQYIPGFNFFRAAGRYLLLWTVAGAVLAAEGVQVLLDRAPQSNKRKASLPGVASIALLVVWVGLQLYAYRILPAHAHRPAVLPLEWVIFSCGLLFCAAIFLAAQRGAAKQWLAPALAVAVSVDLLTFAAPLAPVTSPQFFKELPWTAARILQDKTWFRVWPSRTSQEGDPFFDVGYPWALTLDYYRWDKERMKPNLNIPWHIRTVPGDAAFLREVDFSVNLSESEGFLQAKEGYVNLKRMARLLGAKYLLLRHSDPDLNLVEHRDKLWLYQDTKALPRAWVVGAAESMESALAAGKKTLSAEFDPRREAVLVGAPPIQLSAPGEIDAPIQIEEPRPDRMLLHTQTAAEGVLLLNESYDPNWSARIDGREVSVYQADLLLRGILLPAGSHTIEFYYDNIFIWGGMRVSLAALLLCALLFVRSRVPKKEEAASSTSREKQKPVAGRA